MNSIIIHATDKHYDPIVRELKELAPLRNMKIFHIGRKNSDMRASRVRRMTKDYKDKENNFFQFAKEKTNYFPDLSTEQGKNAYRNDMQLFAKAMSRFSKSYIIRGHSLSSLQDYYNYFNYAIICAVNFLIEQKARVMFFTNVPHLGHDTIFYIACKYLNVKTFIFSQSSVFYDKFIIADSIENYGKFDWKNYDIATQKITFKPEESNIFKHFYMSSIGGREQGKISISDIINTTFYLLIHEPKTLLNPSKLVKTFKRVKTVIEYYPKWRNPFSNFAGIRALNYLESLSKFETSSVDFDKKYVYFPLQLQPEMTTCPLGGDYEDQALAIEHLHEIIPTDVYIYVKENPKQGAFLRDHWFLKRLIRLERVKIVPSFTSSKELLLNSVFCATITGTAGWEAICVGKNCVVFGNAWYRDLPGCYKFHKKLIFDEVANTKHNRQDVVAKINYLITQLRFGTVDRKYASQIKNYDSKTNQKNITSAFLECIDRELS